MSSEDRQAGVELDLAVAEARGLVPCDDWSPGNMGSAGGPCFWKECIHADDACYPTSTMAVMGGGIGGVPRFSEDGHFQALRLKDLPAGYIIIRFEDRFVVENEHGNSYEGKTEAEAICLAYLDSFPEPLFDGDDIYDPIWKQAAEEWGLLDEEGRPISPWTIPTVLYLVQAQRALVLALLAQAPRSPPPQNDPKVQKWLWRLSEAGIGDEAMARVNEILTKTLAERQE
jgi:hypothetical protein